MTREWNDFFAVREDVYFRVLELVGETGTGFALPSGTLYFRRDDGLDPTKGAGAEEAVASWRQAGKFPFPRITPDEIERLKGTLDYPAKDSPDAGTGASAEIAMGAAEPLSSPVLSGFDPEDDEDRGRQHRSRRDE